jgi:malate dehydrogenase
MRKITIVGAGRVGESTAQIVAKEELCREVVLLDIEPGVPQGVALDIQQSASLLRFDTRVTGDTHPAAMRHTDLVIITAGWRSTWALSTALWIRFSSMRRRR